MLALTNACLQYVGFWLAFTLPTIVFCICPVVLYVGRNMYSRSPPTGSVLSQALRIWRQAMKGRWSFNPVTTFKNMNAPDFWETAKPSHYSEETRPGWMTFDDQWVDEVKRGFKACSVFMWYPIYCTYLSTFACRLFVDISFDRAHLQPA